MLLKIKKVSVNNKHDDDNEVEMHALKNTTTNLTAAHVNQTMSNDHVNEKCGMTCLLEKNTFDNKHC